MSEANNRQTPVNVYQEQEDRLIHEESDETDEDEPLLPTDSTASHHQQEVTTPPVAVANNLQQTIGNVEDVSAVVLVEETETNAANLGTNATAEVQTATGSRSRQQQQQQRRKRNVDIPRKYSISVLSLIKPVCIAMLLVIWATRTFSPLLESVPVQSVLMVYREQSDDSFWTKFGGSILNAVIIVICFVLVTLVLVILYKYRCMKIIFGWLIFSAFVLLFVMGWVWLELFLQSYHILLDYVTYFLFLFNFAIVGIVSIFWRANKTVTQFYLVMCGAMTAWWLTRLPEWTSWTILAAVAIYDIIAVLTPRGPLKVLVETAQQRGEPIPGLIYEGKTFKLGLGDFVFYSMLVGRASMYDFTTLVVCFVCILTGLCLTLFILGIFKRALPALPISIGLGIVAYLLTRFIVQPMVLDLNLEQIYM